MDNISVDFELYGHISRGELELISQVSSDDHYRNQIIDEFISENTYAGPLDINVELEQDVILNVKNKIMSDDVVVHKVGMLETSNVSGGYTLYIGGNQNG